MHRFLWRSPSLSSTCKADFSDVLDSTLFEVVEEYTYWLKYIFHLPTCFKNIFDKYILKE